MKLVMEELAFETWLALKSGCFSLHQVPGAVYGIAAGCPAHCLEAERVTRLCRTGICHLFSLCFSPSCFRCPECSLGLGGWLLASAVH